MATGKDISQAHGIPTCCDGNLVNILKIVNRKFSVGTYFHGSARCVVNVHNIMHDAVGSARTTENILRIYIKESLII